MAALFHHRHYQHIAPIISQHHSCHHGLKLSDPGKDLRKGAKIIDNPKWKFRLSLTGSILTSIFMLLSLQIIISRYIYTNSPSCTNVYFSPHTSVSFNVSGLYCDQLTIKKYYDNSPASQWNTSLYLLHQMPNLSTAYEFEISENITLSASGFYKWSFYLHKGSSYTIKACKQNGRELSNDTEVCIIGGDQSLKKWIRTRSCKHPHWSIRMCNSARSVNTFSDVIKETNFYYFVYSTHTLNYETKVSLQIDMAFITLEYSLEESNIYKNCMVDDIVLDGDQSCTIDIPSDFAGAAALATSAPDQPEVWKDTLPVSWECNPAFDSVEIHLFLPSVVPIVLFISFWLSSMCIAKYCHSNTNIMIWPKRIWFVTIVVSTMVVIPTCLAFIILWAQQVAIHFSWSCDSLAAKTPLYFSVPFQAVMSLIILCALLRFFIKSICSKDSKDNKHRDNKMKLNKKKIAIIIIVGMYAVILCAAGFTAVEAIVPIIDSYQQQVNVFTPGDSQIITTVKNYFISSMFMEYVGSPHLSATLYISDEPPQLSKNTVYGTSETVTCNKDVCQHIWQSYLNQYSSVNISVCLDESNGAYATFCINKGMDFNTDGYYDDSQVYVSPGSYSIKSSVLNETNKCFKWTLFIDVRNHKVDRYFFILTGYNQSSINVDLEFNRTDFSPNTSKVTSCTINSHSSESCTSSLLKNIIGSSTALVVVTSDLDKPLFEWQETICIITSYNFRADTLTSVWLPVFFVNIIVLTIFFLLFVLLAYKKAAAAKSN